MSLRQTRPVTLTGHSGGVSQGSVEIEILDPKARTRRAMKTLLIGWGLAVVSVFLPLLHFILVPAFALIAPIVAYVLFQQQSLVVGGSAPCPKCGKPMAFVRTKLRWPIQDVCSSCYENVSATATPAEA